MKAIVFDTGPLISLAMNNLLWLIEPMSKRFKGDFYITEGVKKECVDKPLSGKKFKYEALQNLKLIQDGFLKIYKNPELEEKTKELLDLSNKLFKAKGSYIKNVQYAEVETVVASKLLNADAVVIDEFITRALIEDPTAVRNRMRRKLHTNIDVDKNNLAKFKQEVRDIKVIRSFEFVTVAYELGLFEKFYDLDLPETKKTLLEGLLWAVKLNGCSVKEQEIKEVIQLDREFI